MAATLEPVPVESPDAGVIEEARARQRRHRGIAGLAVVLTAGVVALAVTSAGGGGSQPSKGLAHPARPAGTAVQAIPVACTLTASPFIRSAPSQSLLSILGVLRRPATPADVLPDWLKRYFTSSAKRAGREVFIDYVRRARVVAGDPYYVVPVLNTGCSPHRGRGEGIMLWDSHAGGGGADAATIVRGMAAGFSGRFGQSTVHMLIPDGVATVTLRYPAGKIGGFDRHHAPAFTITTKVVGNLIVVTIPRSGNRLMAPMTMTWHAADGHVVKTFDQL